MALSKAKKKAIHVAEERHLQDQQDRYDEFIWLLSLELNLQEDTVRRELGLL